MPNYSPYRAFYYQRHAAKRRGIEFLFEFEEWLKWWEDQLGSDWFKKRGKGKGKYVMARFGDKGPYVIGNIKCIVGDENTREGNIGHTLSKSSRLKVSAATRGSKNPISKLCEEDIPKIRMLNKQGFSHRQISLRFDVKPSTIANVIQRTAWKHVPD